MIREVFNRNERDLKDIDLLEAIRNERPDLRDKEEKSSNQGYHSHVLIIEGELFKAPKDYNLSGDFNGILDEFEKEINTAESMKGKKLPVPELMSVGKDTFFYSVKEMEATPVPERFMIQFKEQEIQALAKDIVGFINDLEKAFPEKNNFSMVYTDFNLGNILIDDKTKKFVGIVDMASFDYMPKEDYLPSFRSGVAVSLYYDLDSDCKKFQRILRREYNLQKNQPKPSQNIQLKL